MIWWAAVLALFAFWILAMAADYSLGGAVHGFLIAGIAVAVLRTRLGDHPSAALNLRRRGSRSPSKGDRTRAGRT